MTRLDIAVPGEKKEMQAQLSIAVSGTPLGSRQLESPAQGWFTVDAEVTVF
jgi:hypothetical protein